MRKIVCLVVATFATYYAFTQTLEVTDSGNITRERWRDSLLRIDMNQVPSGFLLEYSLFGFESGKYDGVNNDDDIIKDDGRIFELHNILWHSKVNGNATIDVTDNLFEKAFVDNRSSNAVPLTFIYQNYNRIRESALSEGLFTIDADSVGIMDVPGRPSSPYDPYEIFAFAPFKTEITQFNAIQFTLPNELFYMQGLNSVEVDFNDGAGFRSLSKGGSVSIYYSTNGLKYLAARINTAGGTRIAKSVIDYKRPATFSQPDYTQTFEVAPVYTDDDQYLGGSYLKTGSGSMMQRLLADVNPGANVEVLNGCDQVFDKPIIIVEGFDPRGTLTLKELERRFRQETFIATMQDYGYDFVLVDFTNNTGYIENNAKVLEAVINWVNQTKTGTFKSSVIGFSMGGLITRWCLKDMKDRGLQHNVENYFSYDSPHQGANVALGMQYIFREMIRDLPYFRFKSSVKKLDNASKSPAARQMLVTYARYDNGPFNWFPNLSTLDPLRAAFAERLQAKGYPQQTRNFGLAFGRGNNTVNTKDAGNGNQFIAANPFGPRTDIFGGSIGLLFANAEAVGTAVAENNEKATIAYYSFLGFTFRNIFGLTIRPWGILRVRRFDYTGQYPYDDAPGSFEQTQNDFAIDWLAGYGGATTFEHYGHNFLATVSALDLQNQNYSAATKWQSSNMLFNIDNQIISPGQVNGNTLSNPALSPFIAVITGTSDCAALGGCSANPYKNENNNNVTPPNSNQWNHYHNTDITSQFARFIERNILNAQPGNCAGSTLCNRNPAISGSDVICTTGQYQLTNFPQGASIVWEAQNSRIRIDNGQGTNSIAVTYLSSGLEVIKVTITDACGVSVVRTKTINAGTPVLNINYSPQGQCNGSYQTWSLQATSAGTVSSWLWTVDNPSSGSWYIYNRTSPFTLVDVSGGGGISVTATNSCGTARTGVTIYSNCGYYRYTVSPNPASSAVTVEAKQTDNNEPNEATITEINIYDPQGMLKKSQKYGKVKKATLTLNIPDLKTGVYIIEIVDGNRTERQQLSVLK